MSKEALRVAGLTMKALAEKLNITKGAVSQWDPIPADRVLDVCRVTEWKVTPHQLRPDIYPHPDDGLPVEMRGTDKASIPADVSLPV